MASVALARWQSTSASALERMEHAHRILARAHAGRRYATQQLNQGYLVLLSSHFQQFCRDLHNEATGHILRGLAPAVEAIAGRAIVEGRKLDAGNPNAGNLGSDFGRLEMRFWDDVRAHRVRNARRKQRLDELAAWRNAIAHQDFASNAAMNTLRGRRAIRIVEIRRFRQACDGLARSFDAVVLAHVKKVAGPQAGW